MRKGEEYHSAYLCEDYDILERKDLSGFWLSRGQKLMAPWLLCSIENPPFNESLSVVDIPKNWIAI